MNIEKRICIRQRNHCYYNTQLPTEPAQIEALRKHIDLILNSPIELYENCECYLQRDEGGTWHYGHCAVREHERFPLTDRILVRLRNVQANSNYMTKKRYPFFARYEIVRGA